MSGAGINPLAIYDPATYAQQLQIARRQALAQSLMQQGEQDPGSRAYGGLRNAGNAILGAFLAKRADKQLGDLYNPQASYATPQGQSQQNQQAQADQTDTFARRYNMTPQEVMGDNAGQISNMAGSPPTSQQQPQQQSPGYQPSDVPPDYAQLPPQMRRLYDQIPHLPGVSAHESVNYFLTDPKGYQDKVFSARIPKQPEPFTLSPGQHRFDAQNREVATVGEQQDQILTPQDAAARGLPPLQPDSFYKVDPHNSVSVVKTSDLMSPGKMAQESKLASMRAEATAAAAGQFGRSMLGKSYNILSQGLKNPAVRSTPEYITAWQVLSNPQVDPNTGTMIVPDLSAFAPPIMAGNNAQPNMTPGSPGAIPGVPGQRMPSIQSFAPPNPSQPEAAAAGYANRMDTSNSVINQNQQAGTSLANRAKAAIPGVGNYLVSPEYQKLDQAERNFVNAQLRRESGAVISQEEFDNAKRQYFPTPGDSPAVLQQKQQARDMAIKNMQLSAGNVLLPPGVVQQSSPPKTAPVVPQQQGFGAPPSAPSKILRYDAQGRSIQ